MVIKIGDVSVKNQLVLAPMVGITDIAFRLLCKRQGAGLVYTEMANVNALCRNNKSTFKLIDFSEEERPIAVQIFGARTDLAVQAAKIVEEKGADIIDFNLGCPDFKIIKQGAGSALLKRPTKIKEIISSIVKNVNVPVTAKIRIGVEKVKDHIKTAKIIEEAGASAIAVHGRTAKQMYSGKADWDAIKEIKESVEIPVIGNGDIFSGKDAKNMLEFTGVDLIMIGRGAVGNPFIFREIKDFLSGRKVKAVAPKDKINIIFEYIRLAEKNGCYKFASVKRHALNFTKGLDNSTRMRKKISDAEDLDELKKEINNFF